MAQMLMKAAVTGFLCTKIIGLTSSFEVVLALPKVALGQWF